MSTKFPSIKSVRSALVSEWRYLRRNFTQEKLREAGGDFAGVDVRLQVWPNGGWAIHTGPSDYDQDHRGFWGCSCISWERQDLTEIARSLIDQAKDHASDF